jgi:hypothetical protein
LEEFDTNDWGAGLDWVSELGPKVIAEVEIEPWVNLRSGTFERLGYMRAWVPDHGQPPVFLTASGDAFTRGGKDDDKVGESAYKRFVELSSSVRPTYAAITVDWELETPGELQRDSASYAFNDFYLSFSDLPASVIQEVGSVSTGSYREDLPDGVYFSSSSVFNPAGVGNGVGAAQRSASVGAILARHFSKAK